MSSWRGARVSYTFLYRNMSTVRLRFVCRDQTSRSPRSEGVPEADSQRTPRRNRQAAGLEFAGVVAGVTEIGDHQPAAVLEHAGRFANGLRAVRGPGNVVDRQRTDDHIEGAVFEWQLAHVGGVQLDPV